MDSASTTPIDRALDADATVISSDGWRAPRLRPSLPESFRSISVPLGGPWWRKLLAFAGPGYMVAVGYMDPGNWSTDLSAGAEYKYKLLWVVAMSQAVAGIVVPAIFGLFFFAAIVGALLLVIMVLVLLGDLRRT
jgi:hypothetical protein